MLSDERIRELVVSIFEDGKPVYPERYDNAELAIRVAIAEAVAAEREACAELAESKGGIRSSITFEELVLKDVLSIFDLAVRDTKEQLATAIRGREGG